MSDSVINVEVLSGFGSSSITQIVALSQSAYDALTSKVETTLYIVTPNP